MLAVLIALLILVASLAALVLVGVHVFRGVRSLGRTVSDAAGQLAAAAAELDRLRPDEEP